MFQTGDYRIVLLPGVEANSFEKFMIDEVFNDPSVLQRTRITRHFNHQLLLSSAPSPVTHYVWRTTVDLMTDPGYDFEQNAEAIQDRLKHHGALSSIESYSVVQSESFST